MKKQGLGITANTNWSFTSTALFSVAITFWLASCGFTLKAPQSAYTTKLSTTKTSVQNSNLSCHSEKAFSCSLRRFSPNLPKGSYSDEPHCQQLANGKSLCAPVMVYQFDTRKGIEDCADCSVNSAKNRYQNTEAICVYHGIIQDNVYGVRGQGDNIGEALDNAYQACISNKDTHP